MRPRQLHAAEENGMSRLHSNALVLVGFIVIGSPVALGCAHSSQRHTVQSSRPDAHGIERRIVLTPAQPRGKGQTCRLETVFFDVDSALLDDRAKQTALDAVTCFTHNGMPSQLVITGATDPRGTEEYNLALGQRRAAAVQNLLVILGVAPVRISIGSVGEELATGYDEASWRLDRRALAAAP
jgi:outer membrane protein OmpA-like peptidoglycan-associated protein